MPQIDALVRDLVWNRLIDDTLGFNANVDAVKAQGSYDSLDADLVKNNGWKLGETCLWALVDPDLIEESSVMEYPFHCLEIASRQGDGSNRWVMFSTFAGTISFIILAHISWIESDVVPNFASYGDLVQDAMYATLNDPNNQMWVSSVAYSGLLQMTRGPITFKGQNWRQTLTFTGTFAAVIP